MICGLCGAELSTPLLLRSHKASAHDPARWIGRRVRLRNLRPGLDGQLGLCRRYEPEADTAQVELSSCTVRTPAGQPSRLVLVGLRQLVLHVWDRAAVAEARAELGELAELNIKRCVELARSDPDQLVRDQLASLSELQEAAGPGQLEELLEPRVLQYLKYKLTYQAAEASRLRRETMAPRAGVAVLREQDWAVLDQAGLVVLDGVCAGLARLTEAGGARGESTRAAGRRAGNPGADERGA